MSNFTRSSLIKALSVRTNLSIKSARWHVEIMLEAMSEALVTQGTIEFRDFGVISVFKRRPKIGRNPRRPSDGAYQIPAKNVVRFRAGRALNDRLNPLPVVVPVVLPPTPLLPNGGTPAKSIF